MVSILDVKEQRIYQETKPKYSQSRDASILEVRAHFHVFVTALLQSLCW